MEEFFSFLLVPGILVIVCICPLWLALHYAKIFRSQRLLTHEEHTELEKLQEASGRMAERIDTLESILEIRTGTWRDRTDRQAAGAKDE